MTTFRPLLIFWACILGLLAGTAVTLQFIGPPPPRVVTGSKAAPLAPVQEQPARALTFGPGSPSTWVFTD